MFSFLLLDKINNGIQAIINNNVILANIRGLAKVPKILYFAHR